jgi:hypothetical protein
VYEIIENVCFCPGHNGRTAVTRAAPEPPSKECRYVASAAVTQAAAAAAGANEPAPGSASSSPAASEKT